MAMASSLSLIFALEADTAHRRLQIKDKGCTDSSDIHRSKMTMDTFHSASFTFIYLLKHRLSYTYTFSSSCSIN